MKSACAAVGAGVLIDCLCHLFVILRVACLVFVGILLLLSGVHCSRTVEVDECPFQNPVGDVLLRSGAVYGVE